MLCARPCPSSWGAWLAVMAAIAVLCSSGERLLCRSRFARFLSFFAALFSVFTFVSLIVSFRAGMPMQVSAKVHGLCVDAPAETFTWAQRIVDTHTGLQKGLTFVSRHMPDEPATPTFVNTFVDAAEMNASHPAMLVDSTEKWPQAETCNKIAHVVVCFAKMIMIGSALAHLALFLSALAVVKRVCCLRFAAHRAGLLKWRKCDDRCKRTEPAQPTKEVA